MKWKYLLLVILSIGLLYLALMDVNLDDIKDNFSKIVKSYNLLLMVFIYFVILFIRAYRWGLLLSGSKLSYNHLFKINTVGMFMVIALPLRLGELYRPVLLNRDLKVDMGEGMASIFLERFIDLFFLLLILLIYFLTGDHGQTTLPFLSVKFQTLAYSTALFVGSVLLGIIFLVLFRERFIRLIEPVLRLLPEIIHDWAGNFLSSFIKSMGLVGSLKNLLLLTVSSIVMWFCYASCGFLLFQCFSVPLSALHAMALEAFVTLGVAIPTPGLVGGFHLFTKSGLVLMGVAPAVAAAFAIMFHFIQVACAALFGLIVLPSTRISLKEVKNSIKEDSDELPVRETC